MGNGHILVCQERVSAQGMSVISGASSWAHEVGMHMQGRLPRCHVGCHHVCAPGPCAYLQGQDLYSRER